MYDSCEPHNYDITVANTDNVVSRLNIRVVLITILTIRVKLISLFANTFQHPELSSSCRILLGGLYTYMFVYRYIFVPLSCQAL